MDFKVGSKKDEGIYKNINFMSHTVSLTGTIQFEPEPLTKKHSLQATWKKVALVVFDDDIGKYYSWFLKKRFNLLLDRTVRTPHVTFINDAVEDLNQRLGTLKEKEEVWQQLKEKWDGQKIEVIFDLRPFSDATNWWLIVSHKHRDGLHNIRTGLGRPYFGLHLTIGRAQHINLLHSKYINKLIEDDFILVNQDYNNEGAIFIKRIPAERADLYSNTDELIGTVYNEYEFNFVRIQIARKKLIGYYVMWKGQKIPIESNGKVTYWPKGFHDLQEQQLTELFKIQLDEKN
jgi:hypothetical protein